MARLKENSIERMKQRQHEKLMENAKRRIAAHHQNIEAIEQGHPPLMRNFGHSTPEKSLALSQRYIAWWTEYMLTGVKPEGHPHDD